MCRNIKTLYNFDPPATSDEVSAAAVQFVRKLSGFTKPSKVNEAAFEIAIERISAAAQELLNSLVTTAEPKDREVESVKARARAAHGMHRRPDNGKARRKSASIKHGMQENVMHPNVARGNIIHAEHFKAIKQNSWIADGWEVYLVNQQINLSGLRPDWVIINRSEKRAFIIDITAKFSTPHYKKGLQYVGELRSALNDPTWQIVYLEDYWFNATIH